MPVIEILLIRSLIMLPFILVVAAATGQLRRLRTRRYGAHLLRALLNFLAFITYFGALRLMPLADTLAIVFSAPIFIVLFSALFLKEKVGVWRWSAYDATSCPRPTSGPFDGPCATNCTRC